MLFSAQRDGKREHSRSSEMSKLECDTNNIFKPDLGPAELRLAVLYVLYESAVCVCTIRYAESDQIVNSNKLQSTQHEFVTWRIILRKSLDTHL